MQFVDFPKRLPWSAQQRVASACGLRQVFTLSQFQNIMLENTTAPINRSVTTRAQ